MKNTVKLLLSLLLLACSGAAFAEDKYDQLAKELTEAGAPVQGKKIAIIPFSYADNMAAASKDGSVIAERLTIKMINGHKFEIIERSVLNKVMNELKLQNSGMIDASSAQQLGKVLGVDAIITGTLVETSGGQIEVNARMIKTETAQAIGASQVTVDKNWIGDASAAPAPQPAQQPAEEQPVYEQPAAKQAYRRQRGPNQYGFLDVFFGGGSKKIDLTYENSSRGVYMTEVGFAPIGISNGPYNQIALNKMTGSGVGPVGIRVGGFGNGPVGGDFEISVTQNIVKPQTVTGTRNGVTTTFRLPTTGDYLTMTSFGMSGDLMFRVPNPKIDPYFGIGIGMSLNRVQLPFAYGFTNSSVFSRPVDDFGLGFMLRVPVGLRIKLDPKTHLVAEMRYEMNRVSFTRGSISGESDTIVAQGVRFLLGLGFGF